EIEDPDVDVGEGGRRRRRRGVGLRHGHRRKMGCDQADFIRRSSALTNASGTAIARSYRARRFSPAMVERHIAPLEESQSTTTAARRPCLRNMIATSP